MIFTNPYDGASDNNNNNQTVYSVHLMYNHQNYIVRYAVCLGVFAINMKLRWIIIIDVIIDVIDCLLCNAGCCNIMKHVTHI